MSVVRSLLERNAERHPDAVAATFEDGSVWTWQQALRESYRAANRLRANGVARDDRVGILLTNGPDFLRAWWGTACLGATISPLNPSWRGVVLRHALSTVQPALVVTGPEFQQVLDDVTEENSLRTVYGELLVDAGHEAPAIDRPIERWDTHHIHFTSGTTGPSKGVLGSYHHLYMTGAWMGESLQWTPDDVILIDLPMFHSAAQAATVSALNHGASLAVRSKPAMSQYWDVAKESGATFGFLIGTMANFLMARPPAPSDRDHRIRGMNVSPLPPDYEAFQERFGVETLVTAYGSSEAGTPITCVPGTPLIHGSSGRPQKGVEIRLVDEHDIEVPDGATGQVIVRTDDPWRMAMGYCNDPEASAALWRNGWLHTGDQMRRDVGGNYYFVDRLKDALRRRGENISSFEVEAGARGFQGVAETACVAVPDSLGDGDDVKLWVRAEPDADIDFLEFTRYMVDRLPYYMVPRYLELIDEMPKNNSMRIQKYALRDRGNGPATWDLLGHGFRVTRDGLIAESSI